MTTEDDRNRHKSKYNQIGREDKKKKKKKKTKRERNKRAIPGSEEELANLVSTLKFMIVDPEYVQILGETCIFLSQVGELEVAKDLYNSYIKFQSSIASCQSERIETTLKEATVAAKEARKGGNHTAPIVLPCEKEIDALRCVDIQENVVDLFTAL